MTNIIIVIAIIAIIALLVVRSRQNKEDSGVKSKKSTTKSSTKSSAKSSKKDDAEPAPAPVAEPVAPKIDLATLTTKIDLLVNDKEFAKAEGLINQTLKQDASLHSLYEKLLVIYHAQEDDFAVKQLLDTLQKQHLNETYQRIYDEHEAFKTEQSKLEALSTAKKAPDVYEFPSATTNNSSGFDSLTQSESETNPQDNSLRFAALEDELVKPATEAPLDFNINTPTPIPEGVRDIEFQTAPVSPASESLAELDSTPALDFQLTPTPTSLPEVEAPTLEFKVDLPVEEKPETHDLNFSFDAPVKEQPSTQSFDFSLDSVTPATPTLDLNLANLTGEATPDAPAQTTEVATPSTEFADANDPIVQSFSELSTVNPIDLDIELAEHYIRLGSLAAAKGLLTAEHEQPSAQQREKIETLLQKIA